jgi:hypothetical protein
MGEMRKTKLQKELFDRGEQVRRLREMFVQSPNFSALLQGPEHRFVLTNPAYQQLIGHRNVIGLTVREAVPEAERQGFINLRREKRLSERTFKLSFSGQLKGLRKRATWISFISRSRTQPATSPRYLSKGPTSPSGIIRRKPYGPPKRACGN